MAKALPVLVCVHALAAVLSRNLLRDLGPCRLGGDMAHSSKDLADLIIAGHVNGRVVQVVQEVRVGPSLQQEGDVVGLAQEGGQVKGAVSSTPLCVDLLGRDLINQKLNLFDKRRSGRTSQGGRRRKNKGEIVSFQGRAKVCCDR